MSNLFHIFKSYFKDAKKGRKKYRVFVKIKKEKLPRVHTQFNTANTSMSNVDIDGMKLDSAENLIPSLH